MVEWNRSDSGQSQAHRVHYNANPNGGIRFDGERLGPAQSVERVCVAEAADEALVEDDGDHQPIGGADLAEEVRGEIGKVERLQDEEQFGVAEGHKSGEECGEEESESVGELQPSELVGS